MQASPRFIEGDEVRVMRVICILLEDEAEDLSDDSEAALVAHLGETFIVTKHEYVEGPRGEFIMYESKEFGNSFYEQELDFA